MSKYEYLKNKAKEDGIKKIVVGGLIVINNKVLLLERSKDDFMGGIFELPSGNLEIVESLENGLKREIIEETGLIVKKIIRYLGYFDYVSGSGKKARQFNFLVDVVSNSSIKLTEHESYVWTEFEKAENYPITDNVKKILDVYLNK